MAISKEQSVSRLDSMTSLSIFAADMSRKSEVGDATWLSQSSLIIQLKASLVKEIELMAEVAENKSSFEFLQAVRVASNTVGKPRAAAGFFSTNTDSLKSQDRKDDTKNYPLIGKRNAC